MKVSGYHLGILLNGSNINYAVKAMPIVFLRKEISDLKLFYKQ